MRITRVTPHVVRVRDGWPWLLVRIETDEGVDGVGECTDAWATPYLYAGISALSDHLVGRDPTRIEEIWQLVIHRLDNIGEGYTHHLAAAIDIALWDIAGKRLGVAVYELLGGPLRETIPVYGHVPDRFASSSLAEAVESAEAAFAAGFRALKTDPFPWTPARPGDREVAQSVHLNSRQLGESIEWMATLRNSLGSDCDLMVDAHGRLDVPTAISVANALSPLGIAWLEEPCHPEGLDALRQVRHRTDIPLCIGERHFSRRDYLPILREGLVDFIAPEVAWCGGLSEVKRIAAMAEAYFVPVAPHDTLGPVAFAATMHLAVSIPNLHMVEFDSAVFESYAEIAALPTVHRGGELAMPTGPGLGLSIDWERIERSGANNESRRVPAWPH